MHALKTLVVGGTGFLGSAIVEVACNSDHEVSVLSRGQTACDLPTGVHTFHADRLDDLKFLRREKFDYVLDTSAHTPEAVRNLIGAIGSSIERYVQVSSISVYGKFTQAGITETQFIADPSIEDIQVANKVPADKHTDASAYGKSFGPLKHACENIANELLGDKAIIIRSGLLVGAGDKSDRLTWWVRRIDQGGNLPIPNPQAREIQLIDVRDLAEFCFHSAINEYSGIFNVTGHIVNFAKLIEAIINATNSSVDLTWMDEQHFIDAGVKPWSELPLIKPPGENFEFFMQISNDKALQHGLKFRQLSKTLDHLIVWDRSRNDQPLSCGLSSDIEKLLLQKS